MGRNRNETLLFRALTSILVVKAILVPGGGEWLGTPGSLGKWRVKGFCRIVGTLMPFLEFILCLRGVMEWWLGACDLKSGFLGLNSSPTNL